MAVLFAIGVGRARDQRGLRGMGNGCSMRRRGEGQQPSYTLFFGSFLDLGTVKSSLRNRK